MGDVPVGSGASVGTATGVATGVVVGALVGTAIGVATGWLVGTAIGVATGGVTGTAVGTAIGVATGGTETGLTVTPGLAVGETVGNRLRIGACVDGGAIGVSVGRTGKLVG